MDIVISSLKKEDIKILGSTTNIDFGEILIWIAKDIIEGGPISFRYSHITFTNGIESIWPFNSRLLIENPLREKPGYFCYDQGVSQNLSLIPGDKYSISIYFQDEKIEFNNIVEVIAQKMTDEHAVVHINDRTIGPITTPIVAQDRNSQQITFQIKKLYDGVSFLDETKKIYIDYIPIGFSPYEDDNGNVVNFLSDEIHQVKEIIAENDVSYLQFLWNVPPEATKAVGVIRYGISILGTEEFDYIWQTNPSTFTVSANLGIRPIIPVSSPEDVSLLSDILSDVNELKEDVGALQSMDMDKDYNNSEFIIGGGGAEEVM